MFKFRVTALATSLLTLMALIVLSNATASEVDNCCFVDRQCQTDDEWVNGYYAHQNNQCGAPSQTVQLATASQTQPQTATSEAVNNCCFSGWQCSSDGDWTSGYFAFQHDHCAMQSHWEEQMRKRQSAETAAPRNSNQQRKSGNQQRKSGNGQRNSGNQQRQSGNRQQQNQAQDPITLDISYRHIGFTEDGKPVVLVTLPSWQVFWRMYCRTNDDYMCN